MKQMLTDMKYLYLILIILCTGCVEDNRFKQKSDATQEIVDVGIMPRVTSSKQEADSTKLIIIPGVRVGKVTANTSRGELAKLFPPNIAELKDIEVPLGEGMTASGTKIEISDENTFTVIWKNEQKTEVEKVLNFGMAWHLSESIHIGTKWQVLQEKLGNFSLFGFRWDYGGTIQLEGTALEKYQDYLIIRVAPSQDAISSNSQAINAVSGERLFQSTNPNLEQLDLRVSEIVVTLNKP